MDRRTLFFTMPAFAVATATQASSEDQKIFSRETADASWEIVFPESANKDGILLHHILTKPSAGLHILGTAREGVTSGYSGGFAMTGPGTANAVTGNRYQDGQGHGTTGNRVGTGDGFGGHFGFSSEGKGGALAAIKQNSGYTGLSGDGPALAVDNLSDEGEALTSTTSANNGHAISNGFVRHNTREGIITDHRVTHGEDRKAAFIGSRVALYPENEWSGKPSVTGTQVIIGANTTGADQVAASEFITDASKNAGNVGVFAVARGENEVNYGGRFMASGGAVNVALRADGDFWLVDGTLYAPNLPVHDSNSGAAGAGLGEGTVYRTTDGALRIVVSP